MGPEYHKHLSGKARSRFPTTEAGGAKEHGGERREGCVTGGLGLAALASVICLDARQEMTTRSCLVPGGCA